MDADNVPCVRTLKKLLIKTELRAEMERFRADPSCWTDAGANPMLHRTLTASRTCPLFRVDDALFQQVLSILPSLAAKLQAINGRDLLTTLANELGNMWTLVLVEPDAQLDDELFDDEPEDATMAEARALRVRSMHSFTAALAHISNAPGGFEAVYQRTIHASEVHELDEPLRNACQDSFEALDFVVQQALLTNEQEYRRKMRQLSNPLVGPLLNAANPFRVAPFFARFTLRTGLAELLTLRGTRQQLAQLQRGLPASLVAAINAYVEAGRANKAVDVEDLAVAAGNVPHAYREQALELFRCTTLVWQRRETIRLCREPEVTFLLDHAMPAVGAPLAALYDALRVGDEIRGMATLLHDAPTTLPQLPQLRARIFTYVATTLRRDDNLKTLMRWLYEAMCEPQTMDLLALARAHMGEQGMALLAREVEEARRRLRGGAHFKDLTMPLVRTLVPHFQEALNPAARL